MVVATRGENGLYSTSDYYLGSFGLGLHIRHGWLAVRVREGVGRVVFGVFFEEKGVCIYGLEGGIR